MRKGAISIEVMEDIRQKTVSSETINKICSSIQVLQEISVTSSSDISQHTCQALNGVDIFPPLNIDKEELLSFYIPNKNFPVVLLINSENLKIFEYVLARDLFLYHNDYGHMQGFDTEYPLNAPCIIFTGGARKDRFFWRGITVGYREEYQEGCQYPKHKIEAYVVDLGFVVSVSQSGVGRIPGEPVLIVLGMPPHGGRIPAFESPPSFLTKQAAFECWLLDPASVNPASRIQGKWNQFAYEGRTKVILEEDLEGSYPSPFDRKDLTKFRGKFTTKTYLQTSQPPTVSTFINSST